VNREYIRPDGVGARTDPFTHVIRCGDTVYVAGQISLNEDNVIVGRGDPHAQAVQCWENIQRVLNAAGCGVEDVVKMTIFLKDIRHAAEETDVRRQLFSPDRLPVCTQVQVANLGMPDLLMEIDVIAVVPS
jgi:2-iminobutanoate/2-iminopropanoate deaminase